MRIATLLLCLFSLPAYAGLYKWTDEQGKVHYSDVPPPKQSAQSVDVVKPGGITPTPVPATREPSATAPARSRRNSLADEYGPTSVACRNLSSSASLSEAREKGCRIEQSGCTAMRQYQEETERAITRRPRDEPAFVRDVGDSMLEQLKEHMRAKGC